MIIGKTEMEHVAALAMLEFTEEEKILYAEQLRTILDYIHELDKLSLDDIEPAIHLQPLKNVLREDRAAGSEKELLQRVLAEAPEQDKGYFLVPLVID